MEYAISVLRKEIEDLQKEAAQPHTGILAQSDISDGIKSCELAISKLNDECDGNNVEQTSEPVLHKPLVCEAKRTICPTCKKRLSNDKCFNPDCLDNDLPW